MENEATLLPVVEDPLIGKKIQDRYRIIKKLGEGGMGAVYLGEHMMIKRKVAIKCLHGQFASHPEIVARFHREALAATAIGNEHIVEVTDMGTLENGTLFMVLEYLEGHDFSEEIEKNGPQPLGRVVNIICQMCDALTQVHAKGIVHRDLKPENVFLIKRGENPDFVKIFDFGISKFKKSLDGKSAKMTATGSTIGTPYFMSPEQAEGKSDVDHLTDIYALGCIMFNALTGRNAFEATTLSMIIVNICTKPAPSVSDFRQDILPEFENIIFKTLEKDKADRYQNCAELKAALLPFKEVNSQAPSQEEVDKIAGQRAAAEQKDKKKASEKTTVNISSPSKISNIGKVVVASAIIAAVIIGAVLFGVKYLRSNDSSVNNVVSALPAQSANTVPVNTQTQSPQVPAVSTVAPAGTVNVKIITVPEEAKIFLDGSPIANPFDANLPKSIAPRLLEAKADGFKTVSKEIVLQFSQNVILKLMPLSITKMSTKKRKSRKTSDKTPDKTDKPAKKITASETEKKKTETKKDKTGLKSLF